MNYIFNISLGFTRYTDAMLLVFTNTILTYMSGNIHFLFPNPTIAALQILYNNFVAALSAASNGGTILTEHKRRARTELIIGLRLLALYVMTYGQNNPIILLGSGFLINGGRKNSRPLAGIPLIKRVSDGSYKGSFKVKILKVEHALMYELRYTTDAFDLEANWKLVPPITSSTFYIEGLEEGTKVWIQVRSLNTKGRSEWSDPAYFMVR